jgi:hypothetical protein
MYLDFAAPARRSKLSGILLCLVGLGAAIATAGAFREALEERGRLSAELETLSERPRTPGENAATAAEQAETAKVVRELSIPWTDLLAELESASHDMQSQVSLLQVAPDADKRVVRITAEVRTLGDALSYLQRLQQSRVLRYPMLESHDLRKDDPEHPLQVKIAAEWRL